LMIRTPGEYSIRLTVEALPEGQYVATSDDLPGLVAQGRTVAETLDIARDVARKLLDSYSEHGDPLPAGLHLIAERVELDVAVGT
jgi:antitoxin HicB